jgi:calcineurin-like phosphoesterase family protein
MNTWVISDTHFGHRNIIDYCRRPFADASHMDTTMIRRWNERVKPEDLVYHLGDFGMVKDDYAARILRQLAGKKILILGNHDKSAKRMMEFGFDFACEAMVVKPDGMNSRLYLVHHPQQFKPIDVDYVLHGHIHNSTTEERRKLHKGTELVEIPKFNLNLSVELTNYEPVPLVGWVKKAIHERILIG